MQPVAGPVRAPEIGANTGASAGLALRWINSPPLAMRDLRGRAVLIDFWDYTCVNCIRTLPYVKEWHRRYCQTSAPNSGEDRGGGLVIIGVHAPEFSFARTADHVARAVKSFGIEYPVVLDNDYQIWQSYSNRCWPAKYLVDPKGYVRFFHFGEGAYEESERAIQQVLREADPALELPPPMPLLRDMDTPGAACHRVTPELYLGHRRGQIGNESGFQQDATAEYESQKWLRQDTVYIDGAWTSGPESLVVASGAGLAAKLTLAYTASEVNLVMAPPHGAVGRVAVLQDNKPLADGSSGEDVRHDGEGRSFIHVDTPRMYSVVRNRFFGSYTLELESRDVGLSLFAFTFVSCVAPQ